MLRQLLVGGALAILVSAGASAAEITVETVLTGLANPGGVAIRPGDSADRYEVFVADSGASRVIRFWSDEPGKAADAITGFDLGSLGEQPIRVGPIALLFVDRNHLAVGSSGNAGGASVRVYGLTDAKAKLNADEPEQRLELSEGGNVAGADHVFSMVRTRANARVPDAIVLSAVRNDRSGELRKIPIRAGVLGEIQPFVTPAERSDTDGSAAVGLAERGYIVAGEIGSLDKPRDSRLAFYNPIGGARTMEIAVDLYDVVGLAYSAKTGNLYAADFAWMEPERGGVYRIDDASDSGNPECATLRIVDVARPSALAFGPDGALYVAAFGDSDHAAARSGVLLKITGDL